MVDIANQGLVLGLTAAIDADAGTPLDFGRGRFLDLQDGIIAAPASIHPALVRAVQEALAQQE